jgi:hypothetical protein
LSFGRTDFLSSLIPIRSEAAFVNRGTIAGGAVLATVIVSFRLCPGTFSNVLLRSPSETVRFNVGSGNPSRRAAALLIRGWIVGVIVDAGSGLALKLDLREVGTGRPSLSLFIAVEAIEGDPVSETSPSCSNSQ